MGASWALAPLALVVPCTAQGLGTFRWWAFGDLPVVFTILSKESLMKGIWT